MPFVAESRVVATTDDGVISPSVSVIAGVVVAVATDPLTPLAVATLTVVTVPAPPPIAVRKVEASSAETELSALTRMKRTALGLVRVNSPPPTVVAPRVARPAAASASSTSESPKSVMVLATRLPLLARAGKVFAANVVCEKASATDDRRER
jgi:hypothetical protein